MINIGHVWVLGRKVDGIKSIDWMTDNLTSFADCDTLVVDMTTLNEKMVQELGIEKAEKMFDEISKRFRAGGRIICVIAKFFETTTKHYLITNYFWSPILFPVHEIPKGKKIKPMHDFPFENYLEKVKEWNLKLNSTPQAKNGQYQVTSVPSIATDDLILNNSSEILGGSFSYDQSVIQSGTMYLLPPLEDGEVAINTILDILGVIGTTPAPSWSKTLEIPGVKSIEKQIKQKKSNIGNIQKEVSELEIKKESLEKYKKLLYTTDKELEKIVKEALNLLGLKNVRDGRTSSLEDALFDKNHSNWDIFVVEVKGVKKNIDLDDIREAENWVFDYEKMNKAAKGVVIANTFRLEDIKTSEKKRLNFKDFEKHCNDHNVCIIPTFVLFKMVQWVLDGNIPDVKKIELAIANKKGTLSLDELK